MIQITVDIPEGSPALLHKDPESSHVRCTSPRM
jgi:hypothetical protein